MSCQFICRIHPLLGRLTYKEGASALADFMGGQSPLFETIPDSPDHHPARECHALMDAFFPECATFELTMQPVL